MILADKIINERKKNGWSQEELAEQLSVSRQSVSKWEGAQAVPDLQKIIAMADIFGVSTDYLLKDEIEPETMPVVMPVIEDSVSTSNVRKVSLEEANEYLNLSAKKAPRKANGVSLCILSPVILVFLAGLSENHIFGITEKLATTIGIITLLVMIAVAVYLFIMTESNMKRFEYIGAQPIETAYGVSGMVQERKKAMEGRKTSVTAIGVVLCILSAVPLMVAACMEMKNYIIVSMVCVLLIMVSAAVNLFIRVGTEWEACEKLLQEGEYTVTNKATNKKMEAVNGAYWGIVLAIYMGWSFMTMSWGITWIVWPIAAFIFVAVSRIARACFESKM